ncbi:MAG: hypothetical protein EOO51_06380 [Flavobacterium sp.]|nr:MAG: hypothetical protein EOO51_06380 [Flavobacterium sp.]
MKTRYVLLLFFICGAAKAQRYNLISGGFSNLKGISEYNIVFDYSELTVHGFESEAAYLKDKMDKRQTREGKAEEFERNWYENRQNKYEPKFIESFNNRFEKNEITVGKNPNAKYTMTIKTTWIYPGYNAVAAVEPAKISALVTVNESANPKNQLIAVEFNKTIGLEHRMLEFDQGIWIAGAYEKLARNIAIQLKRVM